MSPSDKDLPIDALQRIDKICQAFERAWQSARPVTLSAFLVDVDQERRQLLQELLLMDIEYRQRAGMTVDASQYRRQLPHDGPLVDAVLRQSTRQVDPATEITRESLRPMSDTSREDLPTLPGSASGQPVDDLPDDPAALGDYEILDELGRGGMGVVYKARHRKLNRIVALKTILGGQFAAPRAMQRFYAEARAAAHLDHPGIVPIYEVGESDRQPFYSMAFVPGDSLDELIAAGDLTSRRAAELLRDVAYAIQFAHEHGVVHRDLKPANILVGSDDKPRITDFGLAKLADTDGDLTATGQIVGTPGYVAPEQISGDQIGPAVDIYAIGVILYRILTGKPPFQSTNVFDALFEVLEKEPVPPRVLNRNAPSDLETICLKCMDKNPQQRYSSAAELAADLQRYLHHEPIKARPLSWLGKATVWSRNRPALAATLIGLFAFLLYHLVCTYVWQIASSQRINTYTLSLIGIWGLAACLLQYMQLKWPADRRILYVWAAMEVLLLTAFLLVAFGPASPVTIAYTLLVAGGAIRGRARLVWFVWALSSASYIALLVDAKLRRPIHEITSDKAVPFLLALTIIALVQTLLLRRMARMARVEG